MVQVFSSFNPVDISIAEGLLQEAEIRYFIQDSHISHVLPHMITGTGGIRLIVDDVDYKRARTIINDYFNSDESIEEYRIELDERIVDKIENIEQQTCPFCGSQNIYFTNMPKLSFMKLLFFWFRIRIRPPVVMIYYYQWEACRKYWEIY